MFDLCIVNYNTASELARLMKSLNADIARDSCTVAVSDNGSTDDSRRVLRSIGRRPGSGTRTIFNSNVGYGKACNDLANMGDRPYIGLLNADVWFEHDSLDKIATVFETTDADIVGPKQLNEKKEIVHAGIVGTNSAPRHRSWKVSDPDDKLHKDQVECVTVSGSAYFIRREVWTALTNHNVYRELFPHANGAFLETPHYYEETWCSYFARQLGFKVLYDGNITIGHSWHASHDIGSSQDKMFKVSQDIFRKTCDRVGIERD